MTAAERAAACREVIDEEEWLDLFASFDMHGCGAVDGVSGHGAGRLLEL